MLQEALQKEEGGIKSEGGHKKAVVWGWGGRNTYLQHAISYYALLFPQATRKTKGSKDALRQLENGKKSDRGIGEGLGGESEIFIVEASHLCRHSESSRNSSRLFVYIPLSLPSPPSCLFVGNTPRKEKEIFDFLCGVLTGKKEPI